MAIRANATRIENPLNTSEGELKTKNNNIGKDKPAIIEEIDTIPVDNRTTRKTPMQERVSKGLMASSTPNTVATPFPPRNPAKRGNI